jgi:hypothetical protein
MMSKSMSISSVALLLLACDRGAPPAEEAAPAAVQEAPTTVATKAPEPSTFLDSIPVEEDFEQEAETRVNAATLGATLDELEKEIDAQ